MHRPFPPLICLLLTLLLVGCTRSPAPVPNAGPTLAGKLELYAPARVQASEPAAVRIVRTDAPDGMGVTLVAQGSYGPRIYQALFDQGEAQIVLPGEDTRQSGMMTLAATADAAFGETTLEILPGPPVAPITPLVGPRSIPADGDHWVMVVAIPFDSYGNPVEDGTLLKLRTLHPDAQVETQTMRVHHLVAWQHIFSGTRAGRTAVSVTAQDAYGPEETFMEVPGWPRPFALSATPTDVPADGRQFVILRTTSLHDRFGNPMLDGTLITFVVDTPSGGPRLIPAYTIDGIAEAQLRAPDQPGSITVRATLYGVESKLLHIRFGAGPAIGRFPLSTHVNARDGLVVLEAGPLLGQISQFVSDGALVDFRLTGPDGATQEMQGIAEKGLARVELRLADLAPGRYTVEARLGDGHGNASFGVP